MQFRRKITLFPSFRQTNCWYSAYLRSNLLLWLRVLSLEIREKPSIIVSRGDYRAFFTLHIEIANDTLFSRQQRQLWQQYPWHSLSQLSYKRRIKEDKKAPSSQKKASARQKRKDQEFYLNLNVVKVVFVVIVVVLFSDRRAAFSARHEPFYAAASFSAV